MMRFCVVLGAAHGLKKLAQPSVLYRQEKCQNEKTGVDFTVYSCEALAWLGCVNFGN